MFWLATTPSQIHVVETICMPDALLLQLLRETKMNLAKTLSTTYMEFCVGRDPQIMIRLLYTVTFFRHTLFDRFRFLSAA